MRFLTFNPAVLGLNPNVSVEGHFPSMFFFIYEKTQKTSKQTVKQWTSASFLDHFPIHTLLGDRITPDLSRCEVKEVPLAPSWSGALGR